MTGRRMPTLVDFIALAAPKMELMANTAHVFFPVEGLRRPSGYPAPHNIWLLIALPGILLPQ